MGLMIERRRRRGSLVYYALVPLAPVYKVGKQLKTAIRGPQPFSDVALDPPAMVLSSSNVPLMSAEAGGVHKGPGPEVLGLNRQSIGTVSQIR